MVFSPDTGKYRPEISPYLDTFYAVKKQDFTSCTGFKLHNSKNNPLKTLKGTKLYRLRKAIFFIFCHVWATHSYSMCCCNTNHVKKYLISENKSRTEAVSSPMQYIHIIVVVSMAGDHTSAALFYYLKIIKIITLSTKPNSHNNNTLQNKKNST